VILNSFPRSGSNFLQNVLSSSVPNIHAHSIYSNGVFSKPTTCLKSHALDRSGVRTELTGFWAFDKAPASHIVLVRDPRDMFLSIYDYIKTMRGVDITATNFLSTDFYWTFFTPTALEIMRDANHANACTLLDAYRTWLHSWIIQPPANQVRLRFEDILSDPKGPLTKAFGALGHKAPAKLQGVQTMVSQHGTSGRPRGKAYGRRNAPSQYEPYLKRITSALADEIKELGYDQI
jgi:hypothetical protein